ncbi:MAG: hypothetical protein WCY92_06570 [Novosphingobium sp.]
MGKGLPCSCRRTSFPPGARLRPAQLGSELFAAIGAPAFMDAQPIVTKRAGRYRLIELQDCPATRLAESVTLGAKADKSPACELRRNAFTRMQASVDHHRKEVRERITGHRT